MTGSRTALLASLALCGFAANSLLCRLALAAGEIDAITFTALRLLSGAVALAAIARTQGRGVTGGSWTSALVMFIYAVPFSLAYLRLGAGPGAFILFTTVQLTMMGWGFVRGDRPQPLALVGLAVAIGGMVWMTVPGTFAPDPLGTALMIVAGIAWGAYSLRGRTAKTDPLSNTTGNFVRSLPFVPLLAAGAFTTQTMHVTARGALLACASGAVASGVGYSIWYAALPGMSAVRASVVQLLVPVLAALVAVLALHEPITTRLAGGGALIIVGVLLALQARARQSQ
jgi:drug/metabolite transporter (DMT)-like permease